MESLASLEKIRSQIHASHLYLIVFEALMCWEWLSLLRVEYVHVIRAKWTLFKVCYLLNRYGVLVLATIDTALILAPISRELCRKISWIETFSLVYSLVITDVVLMLRVYAIYEQTRTAAVLLATLLTLEIGTLVAATTQTGTVEIPAGIAEYIGMRGCIAGQTRQINASRMLYLLSVTPLVVNALLLLATLYRSWKIRRIVGTTLPVMKRLQEHGLSYFLVILVFNSINCYFYIQPEFVMRGFNVPGNITISSIVSCRLALSLFGKPRGGTFTRA